MHNNYIRDKANIKLETIRDFTDSYSSQIGAMPSNENEDKADFIQKINNGEIIVDGLNRSPKTSKGETAVVTFDYETSPQHLQNRITIIVDDEEHTIDNRLYISSIENIRINVGDKYRYKLCNNETMSKYIYSEPYTEWNPTDDRY